MVALRDALDLDIEIARTNAHMGALIAEALDVEWRPAYTERSRLTLSGLNALLEGATLALYDGSLRRMERSRPRDLDGSEWVEFRPAPTKIEAVNRLSNLTGSGPERLGPGSKEHKSVLTNLAHHLAPHLDPRASKTSLAKALAYEFGAPWSDRCESTGETISLEGLNVLLAGAERRVGAMGIDRALIVGTPEEEGASLAAALVSAWSPGREPDGAKRVRWEARSAITWMEEQGLTRGPNDLEWQGFYFEAKGRAELNAAFAIPDVPRRVRYGRTVFDYARHYVWDLKVHTEGWSPPGSGGGSRHRAAPLNDMEAMDLCIAEQGLGFLIAGGTAIHDEDGEFRRWQRERKLARGVRSKSSNTGRSRKRKAVFIPHHVEAFYFHNALALDAAKASGAITGFRQGRQAPDRHGGPGRTRRPKYSLTLAKARESGLRVADCRW